MRNYFKYYTLILYISLLIYQGVEGATDNNETDAVTKTNIQINSNGTNVIRRSSIPIELMSIVGRKFITSWLPSFTNYVQGRCFGAVRKLQMTFIPLFFKLGVIGTMLVFLTAMTAKGLLIGIVLLFFNFTGFFAKLYASKIGHHPESSPSWHYPHHASGWSQPIVKPVIKNIHVHVHPPASSSHHTDTHHLSSLHNSHDPHDTYYHHPYDRLSSLTAPASHSSYPSSLFEHKLSDEVPNSIYSDSQSIHYPSAHHPDLYERYDDVSHVSSGAALTPDESAYIDRILSKLS